MFIITYIFFNVGASAAQTNYWNKSIVRTVKFFTCTILWKNRSILASVVFASFRDLLALVQMIQVLVVAQPQFKSVGRFSTFSFCLRWKHRFVQLICMLHVNVAF